MWPPLTHQGPELFHPLQDELLVAQRPHGQSLKALGTELEQVFARQLPVLKAIVLQGVIEAWRENRAGMEGAGSAAAFQAAFSLPQSPFPSCLFLASIRGPWLCSAHFTEGNSEFPQSFPQLLS